MERTGRDRLTLAARADITLSRNSLLNSGVSDFHDFRMSRSDGSDGITRSMTASDPLTPYPMRRPLYLSPSCSPKTNLSV